MPTASNFGVCVTVSGFTDGVFSLCAPTADGPRSCQGSLLRGH